MQAEEAALKAGLLQYEVGPAFERSRSMLESFHSSITDTFGPEKPPEPREPVTLSWKNINVTVSENETPLWKKMMCWKKEEMANIKQILSDVNGTVKSGTLLAIMGASGAGKSTLMNVLAHRNIASVDVSGTVMVNGRTVGLDINTISAYVQQEDLFIGKLTVREHLTFQALLRMDKHLPRQERLYRVDQILDEVGLRRCADTMIGIPGRVRGISGGEQKRLAFASEVLTNPAILFADEPTSGLDSFMAQNVVKSLQNLASQGRTIICTIHQPSSEVFAMFNSILLLAEGRVAYLGPTFGAMTAFAELGHPCPENYNPADHFVHTLAVVPGNEAVTRKRIKEICDAYENREAPRRSSGGILRQDSFMAETNVILASPYKASWIEQFSAVLWRSWLSTKRDTTMFQIRLIENMFLALIVGLIYFQLDINTAGIQNVKGALFFLLTESTFSNLFAVIYTFPAELPVFIREHKNGMYRTDVYFLAKNIAELPVFFLSPLVIAIIPYWMIGLREDFPHFLVCYATLLLTTAVGVSYGYIVSAMASTLQMAMSLSFPLLLPLFLMGGFFLNANSVPVYLIWLKYLSWFEYGFEMLNINQWDGYGQIDVCKQTANSTASCIPDGDAALEFLGVSKDNFAIDIYGLFGLIIGFRLIAFLFLLRRAYKKQ